MRLSRCGASRDLSAKGQARASDAADRWRKMVKRMV
jgi:hypothetical protein